MISQVVGNKAELYGYSTDEKPTEGIKTGSIFWETTISPYAINKYVYDGTTWRLEYANIQISGTSAVQVSGTPNVTIAGTNKFPPLMAINAKTTTTTSAEQNLVGSNSVKAYVEISGTGTISVEFLGSAISGGTFITGGIVKYLSTSQSFVMPCTSDYIKVVATILSGTPTVTVRLQGMVGQAIEDPIPKYKDLGQVITATNMAAGTTIYSPWIDNVQWVRNIRLMVSSDQQYDIVLSSRDTSLVADYGPSPITAQPLTGSIYRSHIFYSPQSVAYGSVVGYSFRCGLKNSSLSANTFGKMNIQLSGL